MVKNINKHYRNLEITAQPIVSKPKVSIEKKHELNTKEEKVENHITQESISFENETIKEDSGKGTKSEKEDKKNSSNKNNTNDNKTKNEQNGFGENGQYDKLNKQ